MSNPSGVEEIDFFFKNDDDDDELPDFLRNEKSQNGSVPVSLKVNCLPYAVREQPSIPLIKFLKENGLKDDYDDVYGAIMVG